MNKATLETNLRNKILQAITKLIEEDFQTDALSVSASEIAVPLLDEEDNEKFALIKVSIPRGTRNVEGSYDPYDGYQAHEDYMDDCAARQEKKDAAAAKKAAAEAERERKRKAKEVIKELNKKGLDAMIHESEGAE